MARGSTEGEIQADPFPLGALAVRPAPRCVNCGGRASGLATGKSRLCESCVLAWAFEPCEPSADTTDPTPSWESDAPVLGPYVLVEEIGRGGMGVIYRAVHRETREVVALKTVLPQYADDPEILARFRREAETAQNLDHPHTMPILEIGCSEKGMSFFTMPLALGGSLHHLNAKYRGRWQRIAELMVKVARAVHHAHLRGILHRDIKPGNILFTEEHEPLIADFGLAKPLIGSNDLTRSCTVLGTPNYVAPEQIAGKASDLTAATDVYGLGAVLFELLTGRPPFVGNNSLEVLEQIGKRPAIRSSRLVSGVPKGLDQICARCLERLPTNRYLSAGDLANDLECWLDGRPIADLPMGSRLRRCLERHPTVRAWCASAGALATVALITWMVRPFPTPSRPAIGVAVIVDAMDGGPVSRQIAQRLTNELRQDLSANHNFELQGRRDNLPVTKTTLLDPLAYGRMVNAQILLTCYVRQVSDGAHLVVRFIRCDSGDAIFEKTISVPKNHSGGTLAVAAKTFLNDLPKSWNALPSSLAKVPTSSSPDAQAFFARAMELTKHRNSRDMEAAIELFRMAKQADPQFVDAHAMLGLALWTMGDSFGYVDRYAAAFQSAQRALTLDPNCAQAHRVVADYHFSAARYEEALQEYGRAVELNPRSAGCCQALTICLRQMGHLEESLPWAKRAVWLEPARGTFYATLGETLSLCGLDDQAETALQRAVELEKDSPDSPFALVALRMWQKRFDEARILSEQMHSRFPDYYYGLNYAAWIDFCSGQLSEAQGYYETMRSKNSYQKQWDFHGGINPASALAYIELRSGSAKQARALAGEALLIDRELLAKYPNNNRILHDIAATYAVFGDEQKALLYLEQALAAGWAEHRSTRIDPRFAKFARLASFEVLLKGEKPKYNAVGDL